MSPVRAEGTTTPAYPSQVVRIIVPAPAGGVSDLLARAVADKLSSAWKQAVIVENRPGIAGIAAAAKSLPDGYTLMLTGNGLAVVNVVNRNLPFDAAKDFAPISQIASVPFVLIAAKSLVPSDLGGVLALARAKPGTLNLATPGQGTSATILAELFKAESGISVTMIPFKGAPDANIALQRGEIDLHFAAADTAITLIQSGKAKAIAIATETRLAALPQVPTMAEAGLPQLRYEGWFGLFAPAGTPQATRDKIYSEVNRIQGMQDFNRTLESQGLTVRVSSPAQFDSALKIDAARYARLFVQTVR